VNYNGNRSAFGRVAKYRHFWRVRLDFSAG
jgi:hypothetical protein